MLLSNFFPLSNIKLIPTYLDDNQQVKNKFE